MKLRKNTLKHITKFFLNNFEYFFIILLTMGYFFLFSDYYYYKGDQTTQLPTILHFFDNGLYQKDSEMQILNPVSVKMIPHLILFSISKITTIPTYIIYVAAYLITSFFIFFLIYKISFKLFSSKAIGLLACILLLFINDGSSAVSNFTIITSSLVPYFLSVPFHLLCFYLILQNKYKSSIFISAMLFYIHGQNSIYSFIAILSVILLFKKDIKLLIKSTFIYLLLISPILFSLFSNFNPFTDYVAKYPLLHLTAFRVPHHILPLWQEIGKFVSLAFGTILLMYINKKNKRLKYWIYSLIFISILGIIFSKFVPIDIILLMYLLRVDVFLRIFFAILLSASIFQLIMHRFEKKDKLKTIKNEYRITIILIILFSITLLSVTPIYHPNILPHKDYLADIYDYIKNNTPKDTLIISSPFIEGVRLYSKRSNVVDFKTNPIGRGKKLQDEWVDRLAALCNVTNLTQPNFYIFQGISYCKYDSLSKEDYLSLCKKYNADYFITYVNNKYWTDILIYNNNLFALYKCIT